MYRNLGKNFIKILILMGKEEFIKEIEMIINMNKCLI